MTTMDRRAVSSVLGYVLTLGITAMLVAGLMMAAGGFVDGQRERVVHSELEVVSERFATDLEHADRLAATLDGDDGVARVDSQLPQTVAGLQYEIAVDELEGDDDTYRITVSTTSQSAEVTTSTTVGVEAGIEETTVRGGDLQIAYDPDGDELEVSDD